MTITEKFKLKSTPKTDILDFMHQIEGLKIPQTFDESQAKFWSDVQILKMKFLNFAKNEAEKYEN